MFKIFIFYFIHSIFIFYFFFFFFFLNFFCTFICEKKVTSSWNPLNRKVLREKRKSSLKFKAKNWDFSRGEWNNYHCKSVLFYKSDLLTDQWGGKNLIKELCYRGEKKHGERERDLWEKERTELVTARVWRENK